MAIIRRKSVAADGSLVEPNWACSGKGVAVGEHDYLVRRAVRWLHKSRGCKVVISEKSPGYSGEVVDALGWLANTRTILVECKVSINDYYKDQSKPFRKQPQYGVGQWRYYLCRPGVIDLSRTALPDKWGLLYCCGHKIQVIREATFFDLYNLRREMKFLMDSDREVTRYRNRDEQKAEAKLHGAAEIA